MARTSGNGRDVACRWKPGQSGNPKGGPKGRFTSLTSLLRKVLDEKQLLREPVPNGQTVAELFVEVLIKLALQGNSTIAKEIIDRIDGKQAVEPAVPEVDLEAVRTKLSKKRDRIKRRKPDDNGNGDGGGPR